MPTDPLQTPIDTAADLISAHAYFAADPALTALTEKVGNLTNALLTNLGKLGLSIAVLAPELGDLKTRGDGFEAELPIVVEISENVMLNKTDRGAWEATKEVVRALHKKPNGLDPVGAMHRAGINEISINPELAAKRIPHAKFLVYHVYAYTRVIF
ncbi:hypothetical protein [Actomonas aquatica]|uniref:Uncharacterized protein n=1 Tax=Actomonas aquatica TaxID=2866162 RepID=A0ABZ1CDV3_9BACT|nr:hypothetical protein [Opitutus sp. WL0086]WRQ89408.1 hypothetical protein K1X11_008300 [Opitutus sp. WL0086]